MPEEFTGPAGASGSHQTTEHEQAPQQSGAANDGLFAWRSRVEALQQRYERAQASAAGKYWAELTAVDFMNSSLAFSALAVLCAFPFLAVVLGATGGDVRQAIITRMGVSAQAAGDVDGFIASGSRAVSTLTLFGAVLLVLGAFGMASTLQTWYQRIYDQPPMKNIPRRLGYQALGVVAFSVYLGVQMWVFHAARPVGGTLLILALTFVSATLFWWCSAYFLLFRRVGWRQLLPAGLATGLLLTGLGVISSLFFSDQVISGEKSYGPAGIALALINYLFGFGICLHLGAVFGRMWIDWQSAGTSGLNQERLD